jgi:hypothetical protein
MNRTLAFRALVLGLGLPAAGPAAACTTHSLFTVTTGSVTGTVTTASKVSFDLVLTFPASDAGAGFSERMTPTDFAVPGGGCVL